MNKNLIIKMFGTFVLRANTFYLFMLIFVVAFLMITTAFSQKKEYRVTGRIVDKLGEPISSADISLAGLVYGCCTESIMTDNEGRFSITREILKGKVLYLYTSHWKENIEDGISLIYPPFFEIGKKDVRFLGKPIKFGNKTTIDVGDVPVMFRYANIYLKLQINGRNLTEEEWKHLWLRLINDNGVLLVERSIAPTVEFDEVDLEESILKLELPEGKWKMQFSRFDYPRKIYEKIIGETTYFEIDVTKNSEILNVSIQDQLF